MNSFSSNEITSYSNDYVNHVPSTPRSLVTDPIVVAYNNTYGMPTDTRMGRTEDGRLIITGHMIETPNWEKFICSRFWGGVDLKCPLVCFLGKNHLRLVDMIPLNGEIVALIEDCNCMGDDCDCCPCKCPSCYTTCESKIPRNIIDITTDKDINHVTECFQKSKTYVEVAEKLNDSLYIKGSQWYSANEHIYGIFNDEVVIL